MFRGDGNCEHVCMATSTKRMRRLWDAYAFPNLRPRPRCAVSSVIRGLGSSPLNGAQKNDLRLLWSNAVRLVRPADASDPRSFMRRLPIYLELDVRRVHCRKCGKVKREGLEWLPTTRSTPSASRLRGRRCRATHRSRTWPRSSSRLAHGQGAGQAIHGGAAEEGGHARPRVIGIDEISIRKGHTYRIVVSDLKRRRRSGSAVRPLRESMATILSLLGEKKCRDIRLAVMDMWKPFRNATNTHAPQAAILFDKFHIMRHLGEALDKVRKREYARLSGRRPQFHQGSEVHAAVAPGESQPRRAARPSRSCWRPTSG